MGNKQSHKYKHGSDDSICKVDEMLWVVGTKLYWEEEYAPHLKLELEQPPEIVSPVPTMQPNVYIVKRTPMQQWITEAKQQAAKKYFDTQLFTFEKNQQRDMQLFVFHRGMGEIAPPTIFGIYKKRDVMRLSLDMDPKFEELDDDEPFMLLGFLVSKRLALKKEAKLTGSTPEQVEEMYKDIPRESKLAITSVLPYDLTKISRNYTNTRHHIIRKWISFVRRHKCEELDELMNHPYKHMAWKVFLSYFYKGDVSPRK